MYKYAQLDENGRCISVSYLSGEVDAEHMMLLSDEDDVQPSDIFDGTTWTRPEPVPYVPEKTQEQKDIEALQQAMLDLMDMLMAP